MKLTRPLLAAIALAVTPAAVDAGAPAAAHAGPGCRAVELALPGGSAALVSFGVAELSPRDARTMPALHVRMILTNTAAPLPWSIDLRTVRLELGPSSAPPRFAFANLVTLPIAIVDRGERAVIDLYFAVPALQGDDGIDGLAIRWQLKTPDAARTLITRLTDEIRPPAPSDLVLPGRGGHWWIDATSPWPLFDHRDGRIVARPPSTVDITQPPRCISVE